jgi:hypothetical protein
MSIVALLIEVLLLVLCVSLLVVNTKKAKAINVHDYAAAAKWEAYDSNIMIGLLMTFVALVIVLS